MIQRITDLWDLAKGTIRDRNDELEEPLLVGGAGYRTDEDADEFRAPTSQSQHVVDEDRLLDDYRTLSWTRLMTIAPETAWNAGFEMGQERKWPLGPDIVEECQAVEELPAAEPDAWKPLFEPTEFNDAHGPLEVAAYKLTDAQLLQWAQRCVKIRAEIAEKAMRQINQEPIAARSEAPDKVIPGAWE